MANKKRITEIDRFRIALCLSSISVNNASAELILLVKKKVDELGGDFSLKDGVEIEHFIINKYKKK